MIPKQTRNSGLRYNKIFPKDHDEWLRLRTEGVGASEVGALLGCSKYATPYRVWRRKLGLDANFEESWAMKQGHIFEPYIAQLFEQEFGFKVIKASAGDWLAVDKEKSYLRVSPDWCYYPTTRKSEKSKCILECKTSRNNYTPECLQDECLSWYCQVQYQMYVFGCKEAYLGFLCTETGNHWFEYIEYNEEFCKNTLIPVIEEFWFNHIETARKHIMDNPKCSMEELEQFAPAYVDVDDTETRFTKEIEGKYIELSEDLQPMIDKYTNLRLQYKELEKGMKMIEDAIKMKMEDAESIIGVNGKAVVTWKANKSSMKFDEKLFKAENADLYKKYQFEKQGARVFKIK